MQNKRKWPAVFAEGYTSLIPKTGEGGPLGTRPLTVLCMVYRLWVGTRLRDVSLWQEAWAHPRSIQLPRLPCSHRRGKGHGRRAGPGVAQGMEPGWLERILCQVFDTIPQAVVLRVAQELGMDKGTLRALAAMYWQLQLAFGLAGSMGKWWRATIGILHGCPVSVVLINLLISICKMEIDDMRKHVVVATRRLPPRKVGPPLPGMP